MIVDGTGRVAVGVAAHPNQKILINNVSQKNIVLEISD